MVLAFLEDWSPRFDRRVSLESLRAELRGLGAVLVALTRDALWCFRPDDEVQAFASRAELDPGDVAALRAAYGVREDVSGADDTGPVEPTLGLFVIDGRNVVAFSHVARVTGGSTPVEVLLGALSTAGRALVSAPRPRSLLVSRREVVAASLVAGFALFLLDACHAPAPSPLSPSVGQPPLAETGPGHVISGNVDLTLDINGALRAVRVEPRVSLLDALRERVGLTGTKKGCDHGQCGACTVLVDGRRVNACLTLAVAVQGAKITTIEGLAHGSELHPMQAAFVAEDALQCGYCTPGQIMSAVGMLAEGHAHSDDEVREAMSGNICRCGAYANIVVAIQRARVST